MVSNPPRENIGDIDPLEARLPAYLFALDALEQSIQRPYIARAHAAELHAVFVLPVPAHGDLDIGVHVERRKAELKPQLRAKGKGLADGVSRQPVQQALLLLRNHGILRDAPGRGLMVRRAQGR